MPVYVKPITLWRAEVENQPGVLAQTLEPLAAAGADLQIVMGYRLPGDRARAAIEIFPVTGARALSAAQTAGLSEAAISACTWQVTTAQGWDTPSQRRWLMPESTLISSSPKSAATATRL